MIDSDNREIFSQNLKFYMSKKNKSRNDICSDLGFKYTTFVDWENGKNYPRIDKIEMLSNYFGIKKSDLIERRPSSIKTENLKDISIIIEQMKKRLTQEDLVLEGKPVTPEDVQSILAGLQIGMEMARKRINEKK